jgi:hypothetical protein
MNTTQNGHKLFLYSMWDMIRQGITNNKQKDNDE